MKYSRSLLCVFALFAAACGSSNSTPTTPSTPTPTVTKIIRLLGSMDFAGVQLGQTKTNTLTVFNDGNTALTFTGLTATNGLTAVLKTAGGSGVIPPGGKQDMPITFTPTAVTSYSGVISVTSDATSGTNTIAFAGQGTLDGIPVFTKSGTGNQVFDMPTYVTRVHVTANTPSSCQNFIMRRNSISFINVILGTCSVADVRTYDGTHQITGGVIDTVSSEGVNWTITEIR